MEGKVTGNLSQGGSSLVNEMVDFWMVGEHLGSAGNGERSDINEAVGGVMQEVWLCENVPSSSSDLPAQSCSSSFPLVDHLPTIPPRLHHVGEGRG